MENGNRLIAYEFEFLECAGKFTIHHTLKMVITSKQSPLMSRFTLDFNLYTGNLVMAFRPPIWLVFYRPELSN